MLENIDWGTIEIVHNEFGTINKNKPLSGQLDLMQENMLRAQLNNYLVDVSFYQDFEDDGEFTIMIVKDQDWDNPFMFRRTNDLKRLEKLVQEFIDFVVA